MINRKICLKRKGLACFAALVCFGIWAGSTRAAEIDYPLSPSDTFSGNIGIIHSAIGAAELVSTVTMTNVAVPANADILKAYLYWGGVNLPSSALGDDQVTFTRIGQSGSNVSADFLRRINLSDHWDANHMICISDVTSMVAAGTFDYQVSNFLMDDKNFGVGLQIVYEDESLPQQDITLYQGADFAFAGDRWDTTDVYHNTVPVVQTVSAADTDRQVNATFFAGDAMINWPGTTKLRPDSLWYKTGSGSAPDPGTLNLVNDPMATMVFNPLVSINGAEWDTVVQGLNLPVGDTWVAFQFESGDGTGTELSSSFTWMSASVEIVPEPATMCMFSLAGLILIRRKTKHR